MTRDKADTEGGGAADEHEGARARLSDYYEGLLVEREARAVGAHLESCASCRAEYRELEETVGAVAGLGRRAAPQHFESGVEEAIHRRSAGRFFGRRAFGDRIPYELLAVLAILLGLAVYAVLRSSETGSFEPGGDQVEQPADGPTGP